MDNHGDDYHGAPFDLLRHRATLSQPGIYLSRDDSIQFQCFSSVASLLVSFRGYYLDSTGELKQFEQQISPTSDRALTSATRPMGDCVLIQLSTALLTGNANRGQLYCRARLMRGVGSGATGFGTILAGYLTDDISQTFPFSPIQGPLEGPGMLRSITGTDPAAGAEISETVPTGARWILYGASMTYVADATVATRTPAVIIDDGTNQLVRTREDEGIAASNTRTLNLGNIGVAQTTIAGNDVLMFPLPMAMFAGFRFRTSTNNLQAGDNWGAPQLFVEEWLEA